ncbi:MAG: ribokinase [Pseudomonadota bacterium]
MSKVVVVGSINVDLCCYLDRWPKVHETVKSRAFKQFLGGKGANQAVAAARLGGDVTFIGAIGRAAYADFAETALKAEDLSLDLVEFADEPTGMAFIDIGPKSENIIRLVGGANAALGAADIEAREAAFEGASVLLLQNEVSEAVCSAAARLARKHGAMVVMDPAPSPPQPWHREITDGFDLFKPNAVEASLYCGFVPQSQEEGARAATAIAERLGCAALVTMGGDGVAWFRDGQTGWMDAPDVTPVDTVGAGDCFSGALAVALVEGMPWDDAVAFAAQAASLSTTREGAMASLPRRAEL